MKNIKCAFIVVCLMGFSTPVFAGAGLGVDITSDRHELRLPILAKRMLIEPVVSYYESDDGKTPYPVPHDKNQSGFRVGVGIFGRSNLNEQMYVYFGGGVGGMTTKSSGYYGQRRSTGFYIAPTIGVSYAPIPRISFSVEFSEYNEVGEGSESDRTTSKATDIENTLIQTKSAFVIRHFF